tara:strand:- start:2865 stop:3881 length:1017 start_codon:yes stop_codon:yes gene_type:complete
MFASARVNWIKTEHHLQAMGRHALRLDHASLKRVRADAQAGYGLHWCSRTSDADFVRTFEGMRDVFAAFGAHISRHSIGTNANGGLGLHILLNVPDEFISAGGDIHDAKNPRNHELLRAAIKWGEATFGRNSVYMARLDLDEESAGVVDLFLAPARPDRRTRNGALRIMSSSAMTELRLRYNARMSYVALQTCWAEWCQEHLDPAINRGRSKVETRAEYLNVEEYKKARALAQRQIDEALDRANAEAQQILAGARDAAADVETERQSLAVERAQLAEQHARVTRMQKVLEIATRTFARLCEVLLKLVPSERLNVERAQNVAQKALQLVQDIGDAPRPY